MNNENPAPATPTAPDESDLPPLPKKRRAFYCTKCGCQTCKPGREHSTHPECSRCNYLGYGADVDYNEDEMRAYARAALASPAAPTAEPVGKRMTIEEAARTDGKSGPFIWWGNVPPGWFLYCATPPAASRPAAPDLVDPSGALRQETGAVDDGQMARDAVRLRWLHSPASNNVDGYEWGIYRVKWESGRASEVWQTNGDFSDLDAAMALPSAPKEPT